MSMPGFDIERRRGRGTASPCRSSARSAAARPTPCTTPSMVDGAIPARSSRSLTIRPSSSRRPLAGRRQAPAPPERRPLEHAEHDVGVADVDGQQHGGVLQPDDFAGDDALDAAAAFHEQRAVARRGPPCARVTAPPGRATRRARPTADGDRRAPPVEHAADRRRAAAPPRHAARRARARASSRPRSTGPAEFGFDRGRPAAPPPADTSPARMFTPKPRMTYSSAAPCADASARMPASFRRPNDEVVRPLDLGREAGRLPDGLGQRHAGRQRQRRRQRHVGAAPAAARQSGAGAAVVGPDDDRHVEARARRREPRPPEAAPARPSASPPRPSCPPAAPPPARRAATSLVDPIAGK